ncbi:MAG: hypothetical protein IJP10_04465 [Clostridia bacterium]|nr:hypothetical protein [Clostridia bacterium]
MSKKSESRSAAKREEKRKKRVVVYIAIVVAVSIIITGLIISRAVLSINEQLVLELMVYEYDISDAPDGEYFGEYESNHLYACVGLLIQDGKIVYLELMDYYGIDADRAPKVFDAVVEYQMLNVPDEEIGTEPTDKIILKAIENALSQI